LDTSGTEYTNNNTKAYWYQNGYQVAYYAKSYLGKTFSNAVPITVANYHRMANVVANNGDSNADGEADYMFLDEAARNARLRNAKVYIKDAAELDAFSGFYQKTKGGTDGFKNIRNCQNIDFILDGDIAHAASWTPVGEEGNCFEGNFHGDGHIVSGLNRSLFGSLCGNVYNLGVTGSFTQSGIANAGGGNVTNCWVVSTGSVSSATKAVNGGTGLTTNCYYYNNYGTREGAVQKPLSAFVGGEVAYSLNGHYLNKKAGNDEAYIDSVRFGNEDFIYADGRIPQSSNIRRKLGQYDPVFPDDYIYFGQNLTYGIAAGTTDDSHVEYPEAINRQVNLTDESLNTKLLVTDAASDNRVYRAIGYYKSKDMGKVHFNKPAAFRANYTLSSGNIYEASGDVDVYKDLTAIDFTGYGDTENLLDYAGISQFTTSGLTRNLLVYADTDSVESYSILDAALSEATLSIGNNNTVALPNDASSVKGHLVDLVGGQYQASRDHYLVDKEFFNCPISYQFTNNNYMWYQRKPDNYVDANSGWEAISLPFTADLVSTQTKGELTHFYQGSTTGHEYWLREFEGQGAAPANAAANTFYAAFDYPAAGTETKTDNNTFLWDYYYSHDAEGTDSDNNKDAYQTYYKDDRTYENYANFSAAVPYIVGFPGSRYYEFDLSGQFVPANRDNSIDKIDAQTISFVSVDNTVVKVSDDELMSVSADGYVYRPNYMNNEVAAGSFFLNAAGSSFDKTLSAQAAVPFRPYFVLESSGAPAVRSIALTRVGLDRGIETETLSGELSAYAKKGCIVVESGLDYDVQITIHNTAGTLVASFVVASGETIVTPIATEGFYVVHSLQPSCNSLVQKLYVIQ